MAETATCITLAPVRRDATDPYPCQVRTYKATMQRSLHLREPYKKTLLEMLINS